jgi:NAD(P)-dependent dehydrogenase (short-subunit alcohol dehydrogenase family)
MLLSGLSFVVTGGTGALGLAVVDRLIAQGARAHVPWIDQREFDRVPRHPDVTLSRVDLADEQAVRSFYRSLGALWGSIHVAGGFAMAPLAETSRAEFERLFTLNAVTSFLCCREAVEAIRRAPAGRGGRLVNVGARPAVHPAGGMVAYSVAKAGVVALTQAVAEEVRAEGILVNAVLPSIMDTPSNRAAMPGADHASWPKVTEVAEAIAWLASPSNTLTSGAAVPVFGRA